MLALIAGTGDLPPALLERLGERPVICAMKGFAPAVTPDLTFRIEQLGRLLTDLHARGVTEVCMAGAVTRPVIDPAAIDEATRPLVRQIMAAIAQGDDGALRAIIAIFENAGFRVRAAHEIAPDLLPQPGVLGRSSIAADHRKDAVTAERTIAQMGHADVGQACIVRDGNVLAREGQSGTDAMLVQLAPTNASDAILFKAPKPNQDRRADLPVIGPQTAQGAVAAGLSGIVIEHDGVIVLKQAEVLSVLDAAGLFLWVRPKGAA